MTFLKGAVQNPVLVGAVMGWFVAQVLKTLIHLMITRIPQSRRAMRPSIPEKAYVRQIL